MTESTTNRPHSIVLSAVWLAVTVALVAMILGGVRQTDAYDETRTAMHVAYVVALLWYLAKTGPSTKQLPELKPLLLRRWAAGRWIPALAVGLLLGLVLASPDGNDIVMLLMMIATVVVLVVWFRQIRLSWFAQGIAAAVIAYLAAIPFRSNGFISAQAHTLLPALVPFMYVAGTIMIRRTGFGENQLATGRYAKALRGFLWGCFLFVPHGLLNAAGGSPGGNLDWVNRAWLPPLTPLFSGIAEEVWFRLLLVPLVYLLLRPAFRGRPEIAVIGALLFSAVTFGLGHGWTFDSFFTTGLLYGLPMAAAFSQRDWEHAVGGHYMVNMIPMVTVFFRV